MRVLNAPVHALGEMLRRGQQTPLSLLTLHIQRSEGVNVALNAIAARRFESAQEDADRAQQELEQGLDRGPLHGIPCTVKEFLAVKDMPHTGGLYIRRGLKATTDAALVTRLKQAGAVIFATTNAPEGGLWHETHNRIYGRTSNPHDLRRSSGGSSGGEGALIAAGGSPFGIGSDVGGSIRLPAAFCGIYGHKPTHTMVPGTGHFPPAPSKPYMTSGPMARSARDLMPILRVIAGPDPGDPLCVPWELGDPDTVPIEHTRVFVVPTNGQASVHPSIQRGCRDAGAMLHARGARVEEISIPELKQAFDIWAVLMGDLGILYDELVTDGGRVPLGRELLRWARGRSRHTGSVLAMIGIERVMKHLPDRVPAMLEASEALQARIEQILGDDGVLLHPAFSRIAPRHRTIGLGNPTDVGLTAVFNILGLPVTVAPIGSYRGLPTSIQIIGSPGDDHRTIAVASALEDATGGWVPAHLRRGPPSRLRRFP